MRPRKEAIEGCGIRERLTPKGQFLAGGSPEDFANFLRRSDTQWRRSYSRLDVPVLRAEASGRQGKHLPRTTFMPAASL